MSEYLEHHGIKDQKWGVRRFQNEDGSYKENESKSKRELNKDRKRKMTHSEARNDELYHYGIKNMKWGIRRFQNEDGSLTPAGEERYGVTRAKGLATGVKTSKTGPYALSRTSEQEFSTFTKDDKAALVRRRQEEATRHLSKGRDILNKEQELKNDKDYIKNAKRQGVDTRELEKDFNRRKNELRKEKRDWKNTDFKEGAGVDEGKFVTDQSKNREASIGVKEKARKAAKDQGVDFDENKRALPEMNSENLAGMARMGEAGQKGAAGAKSMASSINAMRTQSKVHKLVGERKLDKPISKMTDQEIQDTINRWTKEDNIARMVVSNQSHKSQQVENAIGVVGGLSGVASAAFSIASEIKKLK